MYNEYTIKLTNYYIIISVCYPCLPDHGEIKYREK